MPGKTKATTQLIRQVRTCFNQLKALSEMLHADLGINPSMRAVMESLSGDEPRTVPQLAEERGVSRQHIQGIVNALLEQKLVRAEANPEHKRSVLYALTPKGDKVFTQIRAREASPLVALSDVLDSREIAAATEALSRLNQKLATLINREGEDE